MKKVAELIQRREWAQAEERLLNLKKNSPFNPQILFSLGYVMNESGKIDAAITVFRQCIGAAPTHVNAIMNLSVLLMKTGEYKQAIKFAQLAIRHQPNEAKLHYHLSLAWKLYRNSEYSLEAVDQALRFKPQTIPWMVHRLELLNTMQRLPEVADEAKKILKMPGEKENLQALQLLHLSCASYSEWSTITSHSEALQRALTPLNAMLNPTSLMMSIDQPEILARVGQNVSKSYPYHVRPARKWTAGKITLGYLTTDIREHPVAQMLLTILLHHDRERFNIALIQLVPSDKSIIAEKLLSLANQRIDIYNVENPQAMQKIQAAGVDVLIDLTGYTLNHRMDLLALRPCSTQILWLGCPVSTGCRHFDAFIVDSVVAPSGYDEFCSEPLVRLPCCYHPISTGIFNHESTLAREHLGIPQDVILVGILQQPNRIRPEFIEGIARVLARHPHVHLMIRVKNEATAKVSTQLCEWGMTPERIHFAQHFAQRDDYLRVIRLLDLAIDSYPYGGHSTIGETLSLGTPVLTCCGRSIHARVAASMMHDLGLADLVRHSPQEQRETLDQLLTQPELLTSWKNRFKIAADLPSDARHRILVRELEIAYTETLRSAPIQEAAPIQADAVSP